MGTPSLHASTADPDDADPDDDPRNDHHVLRDNELSGQNAEWARLEDAGAISGVLILGGLTVIGWVLLIAIGRRWGVAILAAAVAVQAVRAVRARRFVALARDLEELHRHGAGPR